MKMTDLQKEIVELLTKKDDLIDVYNIWKRLIYLNIYPFFT